ncbi:hypothetical protein GW944_00625 [Candidatus Parcubacteria bacterium]|nr:hypothetical protein [Candidatus Parcubacteria bacterium]
MNSQKGFIGWAILIIIALALLKYYLDWSIFDILSSEEGRATAEYIKKVISISWSYLQVPIAFIWDKIVELVRSF